MYWKNKIEINYLFYGFIFLFVASSTIANILRLESINTDYRNFFIFHCIVQSLIEVCSLIIIGYALEKYFPKKLFYLFIGITFLFFLTHIVDFILIRIMDLSFWEALSIVLDETFANFIEMLVLTGVPLTVWAIIFLLTGLIPIAGIIIYKFSKKLADTKPLSIKNEFLVQGSFCLILSLFLWDLSLSPAMRSDIYQTYQKTLPWKTTFLSVNKKVVELSNNLKIPNLDKSMIRYLEKNSKILHKPNIYIFIFESLRRDFITNSITPNLFKFKRENVSFDLSLSCSNNTHCSWFSIFYSKYPFYWAEIKNHRWEEGSIPLNMLKKSGYKINLLTSSGLHYYQMDELLFGKDKKLLDSIYINDDRKTIEACKSDFTAIDKVINHPASENNIFLIFLESTHFNYSWPDDFKMKFYPVSDGISSCVTYTTNQQINAIKNRYKNALNYLDSLFEKFVKSLKRRNLYDDSIIIVTGDHGEEFFEKGHLFHASHLSHVQTSIPIYYKLGKNIRSIPEENLKITSHVDIFPTILDYLYGPQKYIYPFDGQSLFEENKFHYVLSTRYNGSRTPFEFFIHDGKSKVVLKFNKKNIFDSKELKVVSIRDSKDEIELLNSKQEKTVLSKVKKALDRAFSNTK